MLMRGNQFVDLATIGFIFTIKDLYQNLKMLYDLKRKKKQSKNE